MSGVAPGRGMSRAQFFRLGGAAAAVAAASGSLAPDRADALTPAPGETSVKFYGAVGDGTTDDTAAIQTAINTSRRVYFPAGTYKCTATLSLKTGSVLEGEGVGLAGDPVVKLDFSTLNYARGLQSASGAGQGGYGVTLRNLWVAGEAAAVTDIEGFPSVGYYSQSQAGGLHIADCVLTGFTVNVALVDTDTAFLANVRMGNAVRSNLALLGGCSNVRVLACKLTVPNETGSAASTAALHNILMAPTTGWPLSVTIDGCVIDEVARLGQTVVPATVRVERADDVTISNTLVYVPVNDGSGYGVKIGGACRRVSLRDVRVEPYTVDLNHVPVNTILVDAAASGIVLTNVSTVANGGGDISDNAPDTVWINVNGVTRLRGGLAPGAVNALPTPSPAYRGQLLRLTSAPASTGDRLYECVQAPGGAYTWVQLITQSELDVVSAAISTRERRLPGTLYGLQNWYDLSEASKYSAVSDLSGKGRTTDHRYGTLDPEPATNPSVFGGSRFAHFDGGANRALVASSAVSGTGLTVMWVGRVEVAAGGVGRLFALTNNKSTDFNNSASCLVYHSAANTLTSYRLATLTSSSITDGVPFALFVTYDGVLNRHQLTNGAPSAGVPSTGTLGAVDLVIGGGKQLVSTVGAFTLACDVVEVAVWDRALPAADLDALGLYARRRWAL